MYKSSKGIMLFLFLIFVDQLSKYIIRHSGGFYICNGGIAFGFNLSHFLFLFIVILLIIIASVLIFNYKLSIINFKFPKNIPLIFIFSGAFSNLIDRITFGCVIDFIDLKFWPVFNLADVYITVGAIMVLAKILKSKH